MMQANHDVSRRAFFEDSVEALKFFSGDLAAGVIRDATIESDQQPVAYHFRGAIGERGATAYWTHQVADIMIAGHTVHAHIERQE